MGGYGSGRRDGYKRKSLVEQCLAVDIADPALKREVDLLHRGESYGVEWVRPLSGRFNGDFRIVLERGMHSLLVRLYLRSMNVAETIPLQYTQPHYGGLRWWLECCLCRQRVRKVYLPPQSISFGCSTCMRLGYRSQYVDLTTRLLWKIEAIKFALGVRGRETAIAAPTPPCPAGMTHRRYVRLVNELHTVERRYWEALRKWVDHIKGVGGNQ
ncbi:MAG: hypothetical protein AB7G75_36115 [Candidatus Binatia bacterium]